MVNLDPNRAGGLTREVPWREGTRTRSAKRHELLSLLSAATAVPQLELLETTLILQPRPEGYDLVLTAILFVDCETRVLLPRHRWAVDFVSSTEQRYIANEIDCWPPLLDDRVLPEHQFGIAIRASGLLVSGPDSVRLRAEALISETPGAIEVPEWMDVVVQLPTSGADRTAKVRQRLFKTDRFDTHDNRPTPRTSRTWIYEPGDRN